MNRGLKALVVVLAVIIVALLGVLIFYNPKPATPAPGPSFGATSTVALSLDGHVAVTIPQAGASVASPVSIAGTVTGGGWFFEATFPVKVLDATGAMIGEGQARATADWMSTGTVPFSASVSFRAPATATGSIVFSKDNPSGDPARDESFAVPVVFASSTAPSAPIH
ncbi:MAG TPA: Gmad2 immunoglobulin-like domain-containing protein [Candidatus Paceibacterota bacterium]|nr:Gmad2 immunoglobulin-like domain-containing protein [Candidatus Paceibacterota bacterium]